MKRKLKFIGTAFLALIILLNISCYIDDGGGKMSYKGTFYNTNDSENVCSTTGEPMDYYIDGNFFATIPPGGKVLHILGEGSYIITVKYEGTGQIEEQSYNLDVHEELWFFRFGCN